MKMNETPLIFKSSNKGRVGYKITRCTTPSKQFKKYINPNLLRKAKPNLPEVTEFQVVRHYTNLSTKNYHIDKGFYPLGSCTMKYNPKINDSVAMQTGFANIHPRQSLNSVQGALELYKKLENLLCELTGFERVTLQPSAGSQGELVGLLIMKKYHDKKNNSKEYIIIPETAHGTNPASVIMAGYKVKQVKSDENGMVDVNHLKEIVDDKVAGMMLTQPNTLGIFEKNIDKIVGLIHKYDGLMYMDGANLNAIVGIAKPSLMGFDIMHINLHKTFSTPHGGGGPGAGPVAVTSKLVNFLPYPLVDYNKKENKYYFNYNIKDSIGKVHSFYGNYGILVRAYTYINVLGKEGLKNIALFSVLNANYLKKLLSKKYIVPFSNGTLHEFVISAIKQKERGIKALDIGKNLLDYGFHAPTIYFPINIPESIMIEPTETETKETLEAFADAMCDIDSKIDTQPEHLKNAPYSTPVRRLNETLANRELDVRYSDEA